VNEHNQLTDRLWFLRRPTQFMADVAVLCGAFFVAYLPAVNVQLGDFYLDVVMRQLPFVRSYVIRDRRLYLSLMADGGTLEFTSSP